MNTKKKAAGLSALKDLQPSDPTTEEEAPAPKKAVTRNRPATKAKPVVKAKTKAVPSPAPTTKQPKVPFSLHLPEEAHSKIREIAFHERVTMTKLMLEGIDMLLENRGLPPVSKLNQEEDK